MDIRKAIFPEDFHDRKECGQFRELQSAYRLLHFRKIEWLQAVCYVLYQQQEVFQLPDLQGFQTLVPISSLVELKIAVTRL